MERSFDRQSIGTDQQGVLAGLWASEPAFAQRPGGVLRIPMGTSPASMSIHEESTIAALGPMMGVFNNLVMFDQNVPQNSLASIVPDLAANCSGTTASRSLRPTSNAPGT